MKRYKLLTLFCLLILFINANGQECSPFCPVCSGNGSSAGALISPGTVIPSFLYLPDGDEERGVFNLRSGIASWLDAGIGYTVDSEKMIWSLRFHVFNEEEESLKPSLILGTGSVQTGGNDQSLFCLLSKSWEFNETFSLRVLSGIASLLPDAREYFGLATVTLTITDRWSPFLSYDGINFHPGLSWIPTDWLALAAIYVETETPAISASFRLNLLKNFPKVLPEEQD